MEKTFKQAWLMNKGGPWEIKDAPIPKLGPNEVLVKVKASSICNQTDLNTVKALHPPHDYQGMRMVPHHMRVWDKRIPDELSDVYPARPYPHVPFPITMGHESMGILVDEGPYSYSDEPSLMARTEKPNIGDRVIIHPIVGGFGEYMIGTREATLLKVPDSLSDEEACMYEPVMMVSNVVRQVVRLGDTVLILGQGALGLIATQLAKASGARKIIVSEPIAFKRELALKLGADIAIDPTKKNIVHEIEEMTDGDGIEVVIEAAGEPESIRTLPYLIAQGGRIGQIGACCVPVTVDWSYIHFKGANVTSAMHGMNISSRFKAVTLPLQFIVDGLIDVDKMVTHRYKLDQVEQAMKDVETGNVIKGMFLFD